MPPFSESKAGQKWSVGTTTRKECSGDPFARAATNGEAAAARSSSTTCDVAP